MGSGYDPFPPEMMAILKEVLKDLKSHKGKMLNFVMTHNHMFFNMLEKLESTFDPESWPGEYQLQQTLMKSKTTNDFLINIAGVDLKVQHLVLPPIQNQRTPNGNAPSDSCSIEGQHYSSSPKRSLIS